MMSQIVTYDFEDGNIDGWTQFPQNRWGAIDTSPISATKSLQHTYCSPTENGTDRISVQLPAWDENTGSITWRFLLRHLYAPSSLNHWAVFLTSDVDAEGMVASGGVNGYAIGVNLAGTDDMLNLYRVTNGAFTSILTTSVNWETDIGAINSSIGAVEVERKVDGTFIVKISTEGSFLSLQPQGSVIDTNHEFGGYFGIYFRYTTNYACRLHVDDISFSYNPANLNDPNAQVLEPTEQVEGGIISSLSTAYDLATEVFRFQIEDLGDALALPTYTTKLLFSKVASPNAADWIGTIAGVKLESTTGEVPIISTFVFANFIEINVDQYAMTVNNGSSREFTLSLYLNPDNIVDGATIQLQVDNENHGWETHFNGSEFLSTFPAPVVSNIFYIQVIPTHLYFSNPPEQLLVNETFSITAHAVDIMGNLSTTFETSSVFLGLEQGEGELIPPAAMETNAIGGVAIWDGISYTGRDVFRLNAIANELEMAISGDITVINDTTTHVAVPEEQPIGFAISSNLTTPGQAVEVLRFLIVDNGENDELPTFVRQLFIKRPSGTNMASFSTNIAGVIVRVNEQIIPAGNPHILTASISIPISEETLVVADGETIEVSISIYLKTSGLVDGANLQFMVDSNAHNFLADEEGSTFELVFPEQVISNNFPIDVQATRLSFSSVPQHVGLGEPFSVQVSTVDDNGNLDINSTGIVNLSKNNGEGYLNIPEPIQNISLGKATWTGLEFYQPNPFTLLASSDDYNDVISPLIYCADFTSTLVLPLDFPEDNTISSLAVDTSSALEVFRFRIADQGNTDGLPTYVNRLSFKSFGLPTGMPLNKVIAGALLSLNNEWLNISATTISSNTILLDFEVGDLEIPNGDTLDFSLSIYLKKGGLINGSTIVLYVPPSSHGWQASSMGSGFSNVFGAGLVGPTLQIDVMATSLYFIDQPFIASPNEPINLTVGATDIYGNIDDEASGIASISLDYGPGPFQTNSYEIGLQEGIAQWDDVMLSTTGLYQFKSRAIVNGVVAETISQPIWCGTSPTLLIDEDFDTDPISFSLSNEWIVSTVSPIDGARSLKHGLSSVAGESSLSIPLEIENLGSAPIEWSFVMRNGNWDPSADNTFWFVLASDDVSVKIGDYNGYAVGVNLTGTSDLLSLWRVTKGQTSKLLIQSDLDWGESETVFIKVNRSPKGDWSLWFQPVFGESTIRLAGQANDIQHILSVSCGPVFKYTSSRAGEFWLDNIKVCTASYPPIIQSARMLNLTSVDVTFSAPVNQNDATDISKYTIKTLTGTNIAIQEAYPNNENPAKVSLRTNILPLVDMRLTVKGIHNTEGSLAIRDSVIFGAGTAGTFGSVVINEIMARPSPPVGLPSVEFIELFNRSSIPIALKGWRVQGNSNYANIPDVTIEPNGYLILCGTSGANAMSEFGTAVGVTSFPTLLVGGMFLAIYNENNQVISWVEYSDTWYGDDIKKAGGYSLERIDPNNLVEGKRNWVASNDPSGGTPGRENTVIANNPDIMPPRITELKVVSPTLLELGFSEPMDSLSIALVYSYSIEPGIGNPIWASTSGPKYNRVTLTFATPMSLNQIYDICFDESIVDFSGNQLITECLSVSIPQEPIPGDIIINEVLFNPYTGGVDFVEIYNRSNKTFDLNKLWIANRDRTTLALNEYYASSDTSWLLFPLHYAVLSVNPGLVEQFYYVENPNAMVWTKKMPSYPNDNGYVLVLDEFGTILDEFSYNEKMHLSLLSNVKGVSLERIHPDFTTNDPSSWQSAAQTSGFATPSAKNSQYQEPSDAEDEFTLTPQVFSPDGDGFDDMLLISYSLPEAGFIANIMVFDSRGRRVRRLAANMTLGTSGSIKWDGSTDESKRAPIGAYVIFIEAFDLKGNVKRYKKTCVVAARIGEY
jgi:hypothetical protein